MSGAAFFSRRGGRFDLGFAGGSRGVLRSPRNERCCLFFHGGVGGRFDFGFAGGS